MLNVIKCNALNHLIKDVLATSVKSISTSSVQFKHQETKQWQRSLPYRDEGVQGINLVGVEVQYEKRFLDSCEFPSLDLEERVFDGMKFGDIPILEMTTHKNNTRLACHDHMYSKMYDYTSAVSSACTHSFLYDEISRF